MTLRVPSGFELSPTDGTDLKDFYHPDLTIRLFYALHKMSLYG